MSTMEILSYEDLENSPTFKRLSVLSTINPIDTSNQTEIDGALASSLIVLVVALDKKTIEFKSKSDEYAFFQLMLTCHTIVSQIRPLSRTRH